MSDILGKIFGKDKHGSKDKDKHGHGSDKHSSGVANTTKWNDFCKYALTLDTETKISVSGNFHHTPEVVNLITYGAVSDGNFLKMTKFPL